MEESRRLRPSRGRASGHPSTRLHVTTTRKVPGSTQCLTRASIPNVGGHATSKGVPSLRWLLGSVLLVACSSGKERPHNLYSAEIPPAGSGPDASVPAPTSEGAYQRASCPFVPPSGVSVEGGYLTVAENPGASSPGERGVLLLAAGVFQAAPPNA